MSVGVETLKQLVDWIEGLSSPGILALSQQPMQRVETDPESARKPSNYDTEYSKIVQAVATTTHDVVTLTGDFHQGRFGVARVGEVGRLIELSSSPMSSPPSHDVPAVESFLSTHFPYMDVGSDLGVIIGRPISYEQTGVPGTTPQYHCSTLEFSVTRGGIRLKVDGWRTRPDYVSSRRPQQTTRLHSRIRSRRVRAGLRKVGTEFRHPD